MYDSIEFNEIGRPRLTAVCPSYSISIVTTSPSGLREMADQIRRGSSTSIRLELTYWCINLSENLGSH